MNTERIKEETLRRISFMEEYIDGFKNAIGDEKYILAACICRNMETIIYQCKLDAEAMKDQARLDKSGFPPYAKLGGTGLRHVGSGE